MQWSDHRKWARKLGIPDTVSDYVNRIIDIPDEDQLPADYKAAIAETAEDLVAERGAKSGNSALSLVIEEETKSHDAGRQKRTRGDLAAECMLRFLGEKGDEYVRAWYLHHYLDYLSEKANSGEDIADLIRSYEAEYPDAYSEKIEVFLTERNDELATDIGLSSE